jgi:peptide/nickel transport system substrate-binding protein
MDARTSGSGHSRRRRRRRAIVGGLAGVIVAAVVIVATAATGETAAGKTLVVLESDLSNGLDIDGPSTAQVQTAEMVRNLYDSLFAYPASLKSGILIPNYKVGQAGYLGALATSYQRKNSTTWIVKLRKGVKSCAGNEMTADDVVWSFARAKSATGVSNNSWFIGYVAGLWGLEPVAKNATAKDKQLAGEATKIAKYTVQVKQRFPNELFPRLWTIFSGSIFDKKEALKHATAKDPWAHDFIESKGAAGFGAYCLSSWIKGREFVLTANPNYWRGQPEFTKVIIRKVPQDANRVAAIQSGAATIVTDLTPEEFDNVSKSNKATVLGWFNNRTNSLIFNFKFPPWNLPQSEKLREAVAYAIPYNEIIQKDYFGHAKRWYGQFNSAASGYVGFNIYSTNIAKAKSLVAEAGFPNGKGLEKYTDGLKLFYPAERAGILEPIANRIRTSLASIGIPISLNPIPIGQFATRQQPALGADMGLAMYDFGTPYGADASYAYTLFFLSPPAGFLNTGNYQNKEADALFAKSQRTVGKTRLAVLRRMQEIMMKEDLPQVPLVESEQQIAVRKGITCYQGHPDNQIFFWDLTTGKCKNVYIR